MVALVAPLLPHYPKGDSRGHPPIGLERMLRMYIAQQCLGLSDEGIEDAIYDIQSVRAFVGIDLTPESGPDTTTLLKFRKRAVYEAMMPSTGKLNSPSLPPEPFARFDAVACNWYCDPAPALSGPLRS